MKFLLLPTINQLRPNKEGAAALEIKNGKTDPSPLASSLSRLNGCWRIFLYRDFRTDVTRETANRNVFQLRTRRDEKC